MGEIRFVLKLCPSRIVLRSLVAVIFALPAFASQRQFPTVDQLPPGIFLESQPDLPAPKSVEKRPVSATGLSLTELSEGFRDHLYNDAVRYCTIGYGHLIKKLPCDGSEPQEFRNGLSRPEGSELLTSDMSIARRAVDSLVQVDLTDGQYGALCDFVFNVGVTNFQKSTLLDAVNNEDEDRIPVQFKRWIQANGKKLSALQVRRDREVNLFFHGKQIPKGLPPEGEDTSPIDIRRGEIHQ